MRQLFFFFTYLLIFSTLSFAQSDTLTFNGTLSVSKGNSYKYKLVLTKNGKNWDGYSILDEKGPNETKSTVTLLFSKEKEGMIFSEKKLISSKAKDASFCFVGGLMKMNAKKKQLKGFFLGHDEQKKMCGSGTIVFNLPPAAQPYMTDDGTKDTNISRIVTAKVSESFTVHHPQVRLELWDGGINDGDSLSVWVNGVELKTPFAIQNEKTPIVLELKKGKNILEIKAENEGSQAPNSARITVIDGDKTFSLVSFLKTGEKAKVSLDYTP